jgi:CheY-like chemotaxis protein
MALVAVFNTNDDVVELLRILLEDAGHIVVSAQVDAIKRGHVDLEQFVGHHRPEVVLYDIAPPYERQWAFLNHMRRIPILQDIPFVLTSTNSARVRELAKADEKIYEIIGKPYDLQDILTAVKRSLAGGAATP